MQILLGVTIFARSSILGEGPYLLLLQLLLRFCCGEIVMLTSLSSWSLEALLTLAGSSSFEATVWPIFFVFWGAAFAALCT